MSNNSPKPAKSFLWWSAFIGLCFGPYWVYNIASNRSYKSLELILAIKNIGMTQTGELILMRNLFDLLGFVICMFLCFLWYRFSKKKPMHGKTSRGFGLACFMSGTFFIPSFIGMLMEKHAGDIINMSISKEAFASEVAYYPLKVLGICVFLIGISYILSFKNKSSTC